MAKEKDLYIVPQFLKLSDNELINVNSIASIKLERIIEETEQEGKKQGLTLEQQLYKDFDNLSPNQKTVNEKLIAKLIVTHENGQIFTTNYSSNLNLDKAYSHLKSIVVVHSLLQSDFRKTAEDYMLKINNEKFVEDEDGE